MQISSSHLMILLLTELKRIIVVILFIFTLTLKIVLPQNHFHFWNSVTNGLFLSNSGFAKESLMKFLMVREVNDLHSWWKFHRVYFCYWGDIYTRERIEPNFSGSSSVRFDWIFKKSVRVWFGSVELSKSEFGFGSVRMNF